MGAGPRSVIHVCLPRQVARVMPRIFHTYAIDAGLQMRIAYEWNVFLWTESHRGVI
jgi:hypothetical protein